MPQHSGKPRPDHQDANLGFQTGPKNRMLFTAAPLLTSAILAGPSLAQEQDFSIIANLTSFSPEVLHVERGDLIRWVIGGPGFPRTVTSGESCVPDGLYFDVVIGSPPTNPPVFMWEVPMDILATEIPYFNAYECENGTPGLLRIIDVREVPAEYPTIQAALDAADEYDTILIAAGTYHETGLTPNVNNLLIQGELDDDGNPTVIIGPEPGTKTSPSIMAIDNLDGLRIEGIHFTGSRATSGGGMSITSSNPAIENCLFTDNSATSGGGILCSNGNLTISNCTFRGNSSDDGGAVFLDESEATFNDCLVDNNQTTNNGGGISAIDSTMAISDCWISGNTAGNSGGGLLLENTATTISETRICGNTPDQIAGDWLDKGGTEVVDDCIVIYNVPDEYPTIQAAIDASSDGDVVKIAPGTHLLNNAGFENNGRAISIRGDRNPDGTPAVTLLPSAPGGFSTVYFWMTPSADPGMVIEDIWFQGFEAVQSNFVIGGSTTINNCIFSDGNSSFTAGLVVYVVSEDDPPFDVTITDCIFMNNQSVFGAGVATYGPARVTMTDCYFEGNSDIGQKPPSGGAIQVDAPYANPGSIIGGGQVDLVGCTVVGNSTILDGGGIMVASTGQLTLESSTVCGNTPVQIYGEWTDNGGNYVGEACPEDCPGDFNGDGVVDGGDFGSLLAAWSSCPGCPQDLNGDGEVDGADVGIILSYWGDC